MHLHDEVWREIVRCLVRQCPSCSRVTKRNDPCLPTHCAACCSPGRLVRAMRALSRKPLWRWSPEHTARCLQCSRRIGPGALHWVNDGEGLQGYGAMCPHCGSGEESLVPVPREFRPGVLERWRCCS